MDEHGHDATTPPGTGDAALVGSSDRYASMFHHHPHATYSVDGRGYFTDANVRTLEMTGLTLAQLRESHFAEVIHPDDLPVIQSGFEAAMDGEPQVEEARVVRADGGETVIRCTMIPVVVADQVIGVHGVSEDVTEAKRLVRELEGANLAKTLFLATVSHEVRTPLAALIGATDLLMETELDPEPAHFVDMVHRSSRRLVHLVDDLLEFSGLEAHQTVLHPRPFDVRALVDGVAQWAAPLAEDRGLALSFGVDGSVPTTAVGDPRRITQVVTNLVHNAITFTARGSVEVAVRTRCPAPDPGDTHDRETWVEFTVADTGTGIAAEHVDSLFDPFVQADPFTSHANRGIGLGLPICQKLAALMDGRLQVSSAPGRGSRFVFGLPLGRVAEDAGSSSAGA